MPRRSYFGCCCSAAQSRFQWYSILLAELLLSMTLPGRAMADFDHEPYFARLAISLDRSSNYSDTAARQASVAFPGGSSDNPAAADWQPRHEPHPTVSLTNIRASSDSGAWVTATAGTMKVALPDAGTLSVAYARTDTVDQRARHDLSNDLSSNEFFLSYSRRLSDNVAIGAEFRVADSEVKNQYREPSLAGMPLQSRAKGRGVDGSFGLLVEPISGWFTGIVASVGLVDADTDIQNPRPLPVPPFGTIPAGTILDRFSDDIRSFGLRAGVAYAPLDSRYVVCVDAQYLGVNSNLVGSTEASRLAAGFDLRLSNFLVIRGGFGIDTQSEVTTSIGVSYKGFRDVAIDVAYQYNAQPELRSEFGRFDIFSASLSYRF